MKHNLRFFLIGLIGFSSFACTTNPPKAEVQHGDLLFQNLDCGDLCDAIEAVTYGIDGKDFSHCAMVVEINDSLKVVEAIGSQVQINSLASFYKRSGDSSNITVGRLRPEHRSLIPDASKYAMLQVGEPYDDVFLPNNDKWYCSELIYESYKTANNGKDIFNLEPMTFKDPTSNDFFPAWIEYYKLLNADIPEGEPGLNPGSISRSEKIEIVSIKN